MATLYPGIPSYDDSLVRPQESDLLLGSQKTEQTTSEVVTIPIGIFLFDVKLVHTPGHKMVQSDTLSRRPDLCPDEDNDNADIVMLPDDMFLNLIDVDLQKKIAMADDLDSNALEALKLLLENGPKSMTTGLDDWKIEESHG